MALTGNKYIYIYALTYILYDLLDGAGLVSPLLGCLHTDCLWVYGISQWQDGASQIPICSEVHIELISSRS